MGRCRIWIDIQIRAVRIFNACAVNAECELADTVASVNGMECVIIDSVFGEDMSVPLIGKLGDVDAVLCHGESRWMDDEVERHRAVAAVDSGEVKV